MNSGLSARRGRVTLRDVSLDVEAGELVVVSGRPHSGRRTLLRIAAGVTSPTAGTARFAGVDLARRSMLGVPNGIAYAMTHFEPLVGRSVLEQVAAPLLGRGLSPPRAQKIAFQVLSRADVKACATLTADELDHIETIRVAVARALVTEPALLLVDQPIDGLPPACMRETLFELLHSIAHRDAIAVVLATDDGSGLTGADHALTLDRGTLHGGRSPGRVIPLRGRPRA